MPKPEDIISDAEIERVHANASFGDGMTKRQVVNLATLKAAIGYHNGHTAQVIITEHGLVSAPKNPENRPHITKKGREYLWALYGRDDF